jgi:hypothetical protein
MQIAPAFSTPDIFPVLAAPVRRWLPRAEYEFVASARKKDAPAQVLG